VVLAEDVTIGDGSILGGDPQDLKFKGEETWVEIGAGTIIREYSTINRATSQSFRTVVGRRCFIMSYVHLAHDCHVGDEVTIANGTQCAGHVTIHDRAVLSGLNAVHQFVTIGTYDRIAKRLTERFGNCVTDVEFSIAVKTEADKERLRALAKEIQGQGTARAQKTIAG